MVSARAVLPTPGVPVTRMFGRAAPFRLRFARCRLAGLALPVRRAGELGHLAAQL